jgi:hypothetical protein
MQEASAGPWAEESHLLGNTSHLLGNTLGSLRDLNHRFLDLVGASNGTWAGRCGLSSSVTHKLAALSHEQRAAAAGCPYALFDMRFHDHMHWRARLQGAKWRVAEDAGGDEAAREMASLIVFYAWHAASVAGLSAPLLLGMRAETVDGFRRLTVDSLPSLALSEAKHLSARWQECAAYWSALCNAAGNDNPAALRRVQLYGLQLAAAARLP